MQVVRAGDVIAGRKLLRLIGEGGMGEVWLAVKLELGKAVVLKLIPPLHARNEAARQLFENEARLVAQLDHPNIVPVFDFGRLDELLWFEQEYIHGEDLARLLQRQPRGLPPELAFYVIREALTGLLFAYERDVLHRDIKPHNILASYEGNVRLADFGIAKLRHPGRTPTASGIKGTPGFIAPECLNGRPADHRSDLFAMGLVLWELLGAGRLFAAPTEQATLLLTMECAVPPLAGRGIPVDPALERILRRLLARDPDDRYQSARDVLDDIRRAPGGRDVDSVDLKRFLSPTAITRIPLPSLAAGTPAPLASAEAVPVEIHDQALTPPSSQRAMASGARVAAPASRRRRRRYALAVGLALLCAVAGAAISAAVRSRPHRTPATIAPAELGTSTTRSDAGASARAELTAAAPLHAAADAGAQPPASTTELRAPTPTAPRSPDARATMTSGQSRSTRPARPTTQPDPPRPPTDDQLRITLPGEK